MLVTAFFSVNSLTGSIVYQWTWSNFTQIFTQSVYVTIILRTVLWRSLVTVTDAIVAFPFAFFMARVATPSLRQLLLGAGAAAALGELPRQGLRLDQDPVEKGVAAGVESQLDCPHANLGLHQRRDVDRLLLHLAARS